MRSLLGDRSAQDRLLAFGLAVLGLAEIWLLGADSTPGGVATLAALVVSLPLAYRRRWPLATTAIVLAGFTTVLATSDLSGSGDAYVPWIAMLFSSYAAGAYTRGRATVAGGALALAFAIVITLTDRDGFSVGGVLFFSVITMPPYAAGVAIAGRRRTERTLERRVVQLAGERDAAVALERARIARELHDVVAHGVSVMVVQAQGGGRMVRLEPDEAEQAFAAIERTGRQALGEMRRLLAMLRTSEDSRLAPQPGTARLEDLVAVVREAGVPVELRFEGEHVVLPPGIDVSAYRIVQEALTNVIKHAGPASARVSVRFLADAVELEVSDDGIGRRVDRSDDGHGLVGMRERVAVFGGNLDIEDGVTGGFVVRAQLPFDVARA